MYSTLKYDFIVFFKNNTIFFTKFNIFISKAYTCILYYFLCLSLVILIIGKTNLLHNSKTK